MDARRSGGPVGRGQCGPPLSRGGRTGLRLHRRVLGDARPPLRVPRYSQGGGGGAGRELGAPPTSVLEVATYSARRVLGCGWARAPRGLHSPVAPGPHVSDVGGGVQRSRAGREQGSRSEAPRGSGLVPGSPPWTRPGSGDAGEPVLAPLPGRAESPGRAHAGLAAAASSPGPGWASLLPASALQSQAARPGPRSRLRALVLSFAGSVLDP